ncbi:MAG: Ig-like domain-containing protein, partial [Clostridia bacterium]|nr:Ig-like domain-containing protein [Clostridia bacterium]
YKPTGVELAETGTVMLSLGETLQLNASLLPTTAKSELTWSTSAKKTATVDENGLVTPVKEGTVTITVKTYNGKKDTVKVQVVDPKKVAAVELAESGTVTLNLGETLELHATVLPATAETTLSWSSKNARIATVADGIVTPVKEGTTEITVKSANGKKDSVKVKVVDPKKATAVVLSEEGTVSIGVGEIYVLTAEVQPGTAETTLKWSTSNKKYVIVEEGAVLGVKAGTATITVQTANGKKDTVKVKVVDETAKASYSSFIGDWKLDRVGYMGVSIPAEGLLDGFGLNITKDSISMSFENETETTTEWTMDGGVLVLDGGSYAVSCRLYGKSMLCMDMVEVASGEVVSAWFVK